MSKAHRLVTGILVLALVTLPLQQLWLRPLESVGLGVTLLTLLTSWSGPVLLALAIFCWTRLRPFRSPDWALVGVATVAVLPLLWQLDRVGGLLIGLRYTLLATTAYWIGRAGLLDLTQLDRWLKLIIRALLICAALQLLVWVMLPESLWPSLGFGDQFMAGDWQRLYGAMSGPNQLGTFLGLGGIWLLWRGKISYPEFGILVLVMLLTFSRSAILGLVGGVLVTAVLFETNWRRRSWYLGLGVVVSVAATLLVLGNDTLRTSFVEARNADIRLGILQDTAERFRQSSPLELILGHGAGTAGPAAAVLDEGGFIPENWFLQFGYEFGLLGLSAILFFLVWTVVRAIAAQRAEVAGLVVFISINSLFLHPLSDNFAAAAWFYLLLGLSVTLLSARAKPGMIRS